MAEMMGMQAFQPVQNTTAYQTGKSQLDERDRDQRKAIDNQSAVSGSTDESKIARLDSSNKNYNRGLQNLLAFSQRVRDQNQNRYLNVLGAKNLAKQNRVRQFNQNLDNIMDPLQSAAAAFNMADVFSKGDKTKTLGNWGDGSSKLIYPGGFGGGTSADVIRRG